MSCTFIPVRSSISATNESDRGDVGRRRRAPPPKTMPAREPKRSKTRDPEPPPLPQGSPSRPRSLTSTRARGSLKGASSSFGCWLLTGGSRLTALSAWLDFPTARAVVRPVLKKAPPFCASQSLSITLTCAPCMPKLFETSSCFGGYWSVVLYWSS